LDDLLLVEIDNGLHSLDRTRVKVNAGALDEIHLSLNDAALFLGQSEGTGVSGVTKTFASSSGVSMPRRASAAL
jgi:hypothetical protein